MSVATGIDGLNLTFPLSVNFERDILRLFIGLVPEMFHPEKSPFKGYRNCLTLKTQKNTVLVRFHFNPTAYFGKRNLLEIKGLCFSESALNALKPDGSGTPCLDLSRMLHEATRYGAAVTKLDVYLDDFTGTTPITKIHEMSLPHNFETYIQSPFLKARNGEKPEPRLYKGTLYFGQPKNNACEITTYNKGLSPLQRIHSPLNPIKFTWQRYELRFTGDTSKRVGRQLFAELRQGENINLCVARLFRHYLRFVEPSETNKRPSLWPLQSWWQNLLELAEQLPPVNYSYSGGWK